MDIVFILSDIPAGQILELFGKMFFHDARVNIVYKVLTP
jgi:hypothetical protein